MTMDGAGLFMAPPAAHGRRSGRRGGRRERRPQTRTAAAPTQEPPERPEAPSGEPARPSLLTRFLRFWLGAVTAAATSALSSVVGVLLGFRPAPGQVPLIDAVRAHAWLAVVTALFAFVLAVTALVLVLRPALVERLRSLGAWPAAGSANHDRFTAALAALASGSTVTLVALVGVLLIRPEWCPSDLCVRPVALPGVHDAHLDVSYGAVQATSFLIPGDVGAYDQRHLPATTGPAAVPAAEVGAGRLAVGDPLRIQVQLRDLDAHGIGMFVEQVALLVRVAQPVPTRPAVWYQPSGTSALQVNPHTAVYEGQPAGGLVSATYDTAVPGGHVTLQPGEVDQLTISVESTVSVRARFGVEVTYRIASEQQARTLTLAAPFEVVFVDPRDWQPYTLVGGHFLPF
jgi:hypothetical protein